MGVLLGTAPAPADPVAVASTRGRSLALVLATTVFIVNMWSWALLSPLGPKYKTLLRLSPIAVSVLVALPVVVGSLGRVVAGALTDRHGGRRMMFLVTLAALVPTAYLAFAQGSYDRVHGSTVLVAALSVVALGAVVVAFEPVMPVVTVALLSMAGALGLGNGATFALVSQRVPPEKAGAVAGVVGAAGGLGGFLPPIVMGVVYQLTHHYGIGLMLLSDVALATLVFTLFRLRPAGPPPGSRSGHAPDWAERP